MQIMNKQEIKGYLQYLDQYNLTFENKTKKIINYYFTKTIYPNQPFEYGFRFAKNLFEFLETANLIKKV